MQVFVTGATGYIGLAVVGALVTAGHQVTGLVRSAEKEGQLVQLGATAVRGDLRDPQSYQGALVEHDGLVHIGFDHGPDGVAADRKTLETLIAAARANAGPTSLIYTSGVLCLGNTGNKPADENAPARAIPLVAWRPALESLALAAATSSVAVAVIRPGFVYGGAKGLLAGFFQSSVNDGAAAYVGDGQNRMALVHKGDLAELYRLILEKRARGIFHGVDGSAPRIADLARAASEVAGRTGSTRSIPLEEARHAMGPFAEALCTHQVVMTARAGDLGWTPSHKRALDAMQDEFSEWKAAVGG